MSMPLVRASLVTGAIIAVSAVLPAIVVTASRQLSAQVLAAGREGQAGAVPYGYPHRQDGSALRIVDVSSTETHVCGTFHVQNTSSVPIERVRFVGVLSFTAASRRPVQILESEWTSQPLPPGATTRVDANLVDVDLARREGRGEHVQAFCAIREIVYANGATWGMTPNPNVMVGREAVQQLRPALPLRFLNQTHALVSVPTTLCVDDRGAEYSPGAQLAIRDEPGRWSRCSTDGQWLEIDARTGEAVTQGDRGVVEFDVAVDGAPASVVVKSAAGEVSTMQLAGGRRLGFVPTIAANGDVTVTLHDMSTSPHTLLGSRTLPASEAVRFEEASPAVSVTLTSPRSMRGLR